MAGSGAFVGRRRDLSELESVLEAALAGRGELVLVPGEAGIGKTRLAGEVAERARAAGIGVAWAGCTEAEVAPAFWPWTQLLRALVADDPDLLPESASGPLGRLLPEMAGEDVAGLGGDPESARLEMFDAVASLVQAAARPSAAPARARRPALGRCPLGAAPRLHRSAPPGPPRRPPRHLP
jgi:AAA ATPase domain